MKIAKFLGPLSDLTAGTVGGIYTFEPPVPTDAPIADGHYAGVMIGVRTEPGPSGRNVFMLPLSFLGDGEALEHLKSGRMRMSDAPDEVLVYASMDPAILHTGRDLKVTTVREVLAALGYELDGAEVAS